MCCIFFFLFFFFFGSSSFAKLFGIFMPTATLLCMWFLCDRHNWSLNFLYWFYQLGCLVIIISDLL